MFNASDSPQSDYSNLRSWLNHPVTQQVLEGLNKEAETLKTIMVQLPTERDLGRLMGNLLHREQTFGEIRGLQRLQQAITDFQNDLNGALNPKKDEDNDN